MTSTLTTLRHRWHRAGAEHRVVKVAIPAPNASPENRASHPPHAAINIVPIPSALDRRPFAAGQVVASRDTMA